MSGNTAAPKTVPVSKADLLAVIAGMRASLDALERAVTAETPPVTSSLFPPPPVVNEVPTPEPAATPEPEEVVWTIETFVEKYPFVRSPQDAKEAEYAGWFRFRTGELEEKYPTADANQILTQLDAELSHKLNPLGGTNAAAA